MYASGSEPSEEKYSTVSKAKPSDLKEMKDSGECFFFCYNRYSKTGL